MSEIDRVLSRAARRLWIGSALQASVRGLALAGVALVLMRGAQKLVAFGINWTYGALLAAGLGLLYALVWSIATRPSRLHVARVVAPGAPRWQLQAEQELKKIPFFVRGKARRNTERYAAERGITDITLDTLYEAKAHFSR